MSKDGIRGGEIVSINLAYGLHEADTASQKVGGEAGSLTESNLARSCG